MSYDEKESDSTSEGPKESMENGEMLKTELKNLFGQNEIIQNTLSIAEFNFITDLDLSNRRLTDLPYDFKSLNNVTDLNLSNNEFIEVPQCILDGMKSINILDLSNNKIRHFEKQPTCIAKLRILKLQSNCLFKLPDWLCSHAIKEIYLSGNNLIFSNESHSQAEMIGDRDTIIKYGPSKFSSRLETVYLGLNECCADDNIVQVFPFVDMLCCSDLRQLNLENVRLSDVISDICKFQCLVSLNFSSNVLMWLPDEFCLLSKLEECILSNNILMFLPENFGKLHNLRKLHLNDNKLERLPDSITSLSKLRELDLYNNDLSEFPDVVDSVEAMDLARNILEEPTDDVYAAQKQKLRQKCAPNRFNGCKDIEYDEQHEFFEENSDTDDVNDNEEVVLQEDEDWESDDYWEPGQFVMFWPPPLENTLANKLSFGNDMNATGTVIGQFDDD